MLKPRTISDYSDSVTRASRSVLLEVMTAVGEYRQAIVLVGGWTSYFLLRSRLTFDGTEPMAFGAGKFRHAGSMDIDLAVDPARISGEEYSTIIKLLERRGYEPDKELKYRWNRAVRGLEAPIGVDFLTPKPSATKGGARRHREVQADLPARATEQLELAFRWNESFRLEGELLDKGGMTQVEFNLASLPAIIGLKGLALGSRYKEKDAYDIYALCRHYRADVEETLSILKPHAEADGLREGLGCIRAKFKTAKDAGPAWVAKFFDAASPEDEQRIMLDSFMTMDRVLKGCEM